MVGLVSWIETVPPAEVFPRAWRWVQKVLPTLVSMYWATSDCPGAGTRATAPSQSFPTAQTHAPVVEVVMFTVGSPLAPLAPRTLDVEDFAPLNAASVMLPAKPGAWGTAVTLTLLNGDGAYAVHTSAAPAWVFDITARDQVSPPPDTRPTHCDELPAGPSTAMNATSSSFDPVVVRDADRR